MIRDMIKNKRWHIFFIYALSLLTSCDNTSTPKPKGYFKIPLPKKSYQSFNEPGFPYAFEYPTYGKIIQDSTFFDTIPDNPYWINIDFPEFNSKIYISYKPINSSGNFDLLIKDAFKMTGKHSVKASYIEEIPFKESNHVTGILFDVGGNAATGKQFFATDSTLHFLRGALYFDAVPNYDSILPVENFLYEDVLHLIKSLRWKK